MSKPVPCLYCQTKNDPSRETCSSCGMPLATKHPGDRMIKVNFFRKAFWAIAIFCVFMIFFLPR